MPSTRSLAEFQDTTWAVSKPAFAKPNGLYLQFQRGRGIAGKGGGWFSRSMTSFKLVRERVKTFSVIRSHFSILIVQGDEHKGVILLAMLSFNSTQHSGLSYAMKNAILGN